MEGFGAGLAFWTLAAVTVAAGAGIVLVRNLFYAVLCLVLVLISVAGFFVLLAAPFLAMAQVIIYVGAITVLMLFAILLTPRAERDNGETWMALPALIIALVLFVVAAFVILDTSWAPAAGPPAVGVEDLGRALLSRWAFPFELASVLLTAALVGSLMLVRSRDEDREGRE